MYSDKILFVKTNSALVALFISLFKFVESVLSPAILATLSAARSLEIDESLASTYDLIAFTDGYFVFDAASVTTFVDLLTKSSFNKSALVLFTISAAKLVVRVFSAFVALVTSAAKLLVKTTSAAALIFASLVKAAFCAVDPAST